MTRLIDANAMTDELIKGIEADTDKSIQASLAKSVCMLICKVIERQPTIDAVPLSAVRKAAKKLAYIHQQIDLYGDRPDLHEEEYWLEYLMDEEWEDADIGWE